MKRPFLAAALMALTPTIASAACPAAMTCVRITTTEGAIVVALDPKRAPITTKNFLRYADDRRFDGTRFYRVARTKGRKGAGFIQGGTRRSVRLMLPSIPHEPTSKTGIKHLDGTISMARMEPGTAMGDFFITAGPTPSMDAKPGNPGYAAFGRVVSGMPVVKKILAMKTLSGAGAGPMRDQYLEKPVVMTSVRREP